MTKDELLDHIKDVASFLRDLESALPGKVEAELLSFLEAIDNHAWLGDLLIAHMSNAKKVVKSARTI